MRRVITLLPLLCGFAPQSGSPFLQSPEPWVELSPSPRPHQASPRRVSHAWDRPSNVAALLQPITGARFVMDRGAAILEAIEALPPERRALGVSGLTAAQLRTEICESIEIDFEVVHQGQPHELRYQIEAYLWATEPQPSLYALSSTCTAALLASTGTIAEAVQAGCGVEDEEAHFPAGSSCRSCLELDGDHSRCVAEGACREEMAREMLVGTRWFDVLDASYLACAPNLMAPLFVLTAELGEANAVSGPFEHAPIEHLCTWFWREDVGELRAYCHSPDDALHPTLTDLVVGRAVHIRRPGSTASPHEGRLVFAAGATVEGTVFAGMPLPLGAVGEISESTENGGYGANPQTLRPDGTDPTNIDHTWARDWIATVSMKTATTITGVPVSFYNRNTCRPEHWRGPDAKGRHFCLQPYDVEDVQPPYDEHWAYDWAAFYFEVDPPRVEIRPMVTLAATGLMDPEIAGGHVSELFGSEELADPDWEGCAWPNQFVPDEMRTYSNDQDVYTNTSQTYRFGKDRDRDIRMVLATDWRRGFCPGPVEP